jgi:hypothetical protein
MKIAYTALVLAALCSNVHAEIDADTSKKLAVLKSLALSPERISPQQVSKALGVALDPHCAEVEQQGMGKYYVCGYVPREEDSHLFAFRHYKTVNRSAKEDSGGGVMFSTQGEKNCLRSKDLAEVFQIPPVASDSPAYPEPTLPYIPMRSYQFVFPAQGDSEVHVDVVETGGCINTVTLIKSSYHDR